MKKYLFTIPILFWLLIPGFVSAGFVYTASFAPEESTEETTTSSSSGGVVLLPVSNTTPPVSSTTAPVISGCTDSKALNYNKNATQHTDTCLYEGEEIATSTPPSCVVYFTEYQKNGSYSDEVTKIKEFLNTTEGESLTVSRAYDSALIKAVKRFQQKYYIDILLPWKHNTPTGYWYQSTRKQANKILGCPEGKVLLDNGVIVE